MVRMQPPHLQLMGNTLRFPICIMELVLHCLLGLLSQLNVLIYVNGLEQRVSSAKLTFKEQGHKRTL